MDREGVDWLGILDDGRFLGWISGDDVRDAALSGASLGSLDRFAPSARVTPQVTLKAAMEQIMVSYTSVAVIDDNGRFGGVVTLEDLRRPLAAP